MEIAHFTLHLKTHVLHWPQYASACRQTSSRHCRMTGHILLQQCFQFGQRINISLAIPAAEDFPLTMSVIIDKCMLFIFFPSRHTDWTFLFHLLPLFIIPLVSLCIAFSTLKSILSPLEWSSICETESSSVYFLSWVINES